MTAIEDILRDVAPACLAGASLNTEFIMVRCPFHGGGTEKTPSCSVSRTKPVFFCHGCSTGGHVSRFLRQVGAPADIARSAVGRVDYDFSEGGNEGDHSIFTGKNPYRGRYLLNDDMLDGWRMCPSSLVAAGFTQTTLRHFEVGVDSSSARITFPLRNLYGELVGVSGRTYVEGTEPRYKIYSNRDLAQFGVPNDYSTKEIKGAMLWHAHLIFPIAFRERSPIIITEGFKAAMWCWQSGFHNVVALIGAHLTKLQAELLARTASDVILFLDNNPAGRKGTHEAAKLLLSKNLLKVAKYPDERQQPDALNPEEASNAISGAEHFIRWKIKNREVQSS